MKIVITAAGNQLSAAFDKRFGRGAWFCVYDDKSGQAEFIQNPGKDANNGAGTKAAEKMVAMSVDKVISGDFGPKAKDMLEKFNVQMVILQDDGLTVQNIIDRMKSNS